MLINLYDCISRDLHGYKAKGDKFSDVMLFVISPNKFASCEQKKLTGNDIVQILEICHRTNNDFIWEFVSFTYNSVIKLIFLQAALLSKTKGLWKRSKNIFGFSVVLEFKVKYGTILTFKVIFLCQIEKLAELIWFFFHWRILKKNTYQFLYVTYFENFDF